MRIDGEWLCCEDGMVRPVIRGDILAADGDWKAAEFLVDTGADRTVLSAPLLAKLNLAAIDTREDISGLGGAADSVIVETQIQFEREGGRQVIFRGHYAAVTEVTALDISVLGRDVMDLFCNHRRQAERCRLYDRTATSLHHRSDLKTLS